MPDQLAEKFSIRAIEAQPLGYAKAVFDDTWRVFRWDRKIFPNAQTYDEYIFRYDSVPIPAWDDATGKYPSDAAAYVHGNPLTKVVAPFANIIRGYQRYVWLPGTVYGLILLFLGAGGILLDWRRLGGDALLPWTISFALIFIPAATAEFDYRYVLPAVPFGCLAAVMAFSPGTAGGRLVRRLAGLARGPRRQPRGRRDSSGGPGRLERLGVPPSPGRSASPGVSPAARASRLLCGRFRRRPG